MDQRRLKPRPGDIIPLALAIMLAGIPLFLSSGNGESVRVVCRGNTVAEVALLSDTTLTIESAVGPTLIRISEGSVFVVEANCPQKICIATGRISKPGRAIICAPGRVAIIVEGNEKYDGITK